MILYIVKSSGKLLHFTDVLSIDETVVFFINPDDPYLVCKFSAESAYIVCCPNKKQSPKTTINAIIAICYNRKKSCSVGVEILFKPYTCAYKFQA